MKPGVKKTHQKKRAGGVAEDTAFSSNPNTAKKKFYPSWFFTGHVNQNRLSCGLILYYP
jgi:hypothetical protein